MSDNSYLLQKNSKWIEKKTQKAYYVTDFATDGKTLERMVIYTDGGNKFIRKVNEFLDMFDWAQPSIFIRRKADS